MLQIPDLRVIALFSVSLFPAFLRILNDSFLNLSGISSNCHASYRQWTKVTPPSLRALSGEPYQVVWIWIHLTYEYYL